LFFAIKGERLDGHHYLQDLYNKGIRNFVVQNNDAILNYADVNYVVVKNSLERFKK
jgi:UDP-N-acetylmuramyl pentapeptide synthase